MPTSSPISFILLLQIFLSVSSLAGEEHSCDSAQAKTHHLLGVKYYEKQNYPKAIEEFNLSLKLNTHTGEERAHSTLYLGRSYFFSKKYEEACAALSAVLYGVDMKSTLYQAATSLLHQTLGEMKLLDSKEIPHDTYLNTHPEKPGVLEDIHPENDAVAGKFYDIALDYYRKALVIFNPSPLSDIFGLRDPTTWDDTFHLGDPSHPNTPINWLDQSIILLKDSIQNLNSSLQFDGRNENSHTVPLQLLALSYFNLSCAYFELFFLCNDLKANQECLLACTKALSIKMDWDDLCRGRIEFMMAVSQYLLEDYEKSKECLINILPSTFAQESGNRAVICYYLGSTYFKMHEFSWAIRELQTSLKLKNSVFSAITCLRLGIAYCKVGEYTSSTTSLAQSFDLESNPTYKVLALYNLGIVYFETEKYTDAKTALKKALSIKACKGIYQERTLDALSVTLFILGDYPSAIKEFARAQALNIKPSLFDKWQKRTSAITEMTEKFKAASTEFAKYRQDLLDEQLYGPNLPQILSLNTHSQSQT